MEKRVLIVDDEKPVLELLSEFFRTFQHGHSYVIETSTNGADALLSLLKSRPDLVLLDMNMPGMSGLDLLKQIRALDRQLPVMMVTANQDSAKAAETLQHGVFAYIPKPFDFRYLDTLVATVFARR